jgi:hypothetical protein
MEYGVCMSPFEYPGELPEGGEIMSTLCSSQLEGGFVPKTYASICLARVVTTADVCAVRGKVASVSCSSVDGSATCVTGV